MPRKSNKKLTLPLLITRGAVIFPGTVANIDVGRLFSVSAMQKSREQCDNKIIVVSQNDITVNEPNVDQVMTVGTLCNIDIVKEINGIYRLKVSSLSRVFLPEISKTEYNGRPSYDCVYELFPVNDETVNPKMEEDLNTILTAIDESENHLFIPRPVLYRIEKGVSMVEATNIFGHYIEMPFLTRQKLLEDSSISSRLAKLAEIVSSGKLEDRIERKLNKTIRDKSEANQKEYILREKMKAIQEELNQMNDQDEEDNVDRYIKKLDENPYPENIKKKIKSEINHFKQLPGSSVEASMAKTYIDTMMSIPWFEESIDDNDILHAEKILDEDHYGLTKVKERILEYLAVKSVTNSLKAPILCLYGPPGTGKTSLAKSIARALNRIFVKASLGGTSDEAEIRGHRRTYVASMPGKIIKGLKQAKVVNPVFLLDEIDKITSNNHGDPASALLEVLDPEQNSFFQDNYIEEPYNLSKVLFIATANYLENIPPALKDRLELIELNTYTNEEKFHIAVEHLIPKQCVNNGIDHSIISIEDDAIYYIMDHYTREAGVRELERKIGTIIRKALVEKLKTNSSETIKITISKVKEYLGVEFFDISQKEKDDQIGVVTGLAYTQYGGDTLPIEVNYYEGKGGLVLTGNLGNVMKESASIALSYIRSNAEKYHIPADFFTKNDIHIHVPEGAVPKDGPSAGIALTVALVSACSNVPVRSSVAMTGEVTLRGNALAIGGLKEKSLAAYRAGIKKVLIPRENEKNLSDLPTVVKENVEFVLLDNVDQALEHALVK